MPYSEKADSAADPGVPTSSLTDDKRRSRRHSPSVSRHASAEVRRPTRPARTAVPVFSQAHQVPPCRFDNGRAETPGLRCSLSSWPPHRVADATADVESYATQWDSTSRHHRPRATRPGRLEERRWDLTPQAATRESRAREADRTWRHSLSEPATTSAARSLLARRVDAIAAGLAKRWHSPSARRAHAGDAGAYGRTRERGNGIWQARDDCHMPVATGGWTAPAGPLTRIFERGLHGRTHCEAHVPATRCIAHAERLRATALVSAGDPLKDAKSERGQASRRDGTPLLLRLADDLARIVVSESNWPR